MKKGLVSVLITTVCVLSTYVAVFAAGSVSVSGDRDTAAVGDNYTVSVKIEDAEGAAVAPDVSVNYDVNRLEFVNCSSEYGGGAGGYITISGDADISFNILSGGQADVDVTGIFDGDGANAQVVTASVFVEGEDTAATDERAREDGSTGIEAGSVPTPDGKIVSSVFADEIMPVGFHKTTVTYEEQMVEAAQFDMGGIILLYVTDADGNNGNFKIYDQATFELSDFLQISGIENRFIIALKAGADVEPPKDFTKAELQWNAQQLEAYAYVGTPGDTNGINVSDFFLLYAVSSEGNKGWYMYDQADGTYQRYVPGLHGGASSSSDSLLSQITAPANSSDGEEGGINVVLIIAIALGVLLLALIITVIVMAVKLHEYNSYDYIDEDEEEGDSYLNRLAASQDNSVFEPRTNNPYVQMNDDENAGAKDDAITIESIDEKDEASSNIPDEFVVRSKNRDNGELNDGDGLFSPYSRDDDDEEDDYPRKMSRADKKAMKQAEKARKKEEKRLKKEYGEYGPVDWESWQNGVESGERTAAAQLNRGEDDIVRPRRKPVYEDEMPEEFEGGRNRAVKEPVAEPEPQQASYPKGNPMDMMRGIPANDNGAPVQAKPVQQFDFDDDFEFEFLDLDDDD